MHTAHSERAQLSLKERQRREREQLILKAAEEIFLEKGYYEASMDEIAARVGIAKGTLYLHFPGKEELVMAIFERDMQAFLSETDTILALQATPRARLEMFLRFMHNGFFGKRAQLMSTIYSGVDLKRMMTKNGGTINMLWEAVAARVSTLLEEGKASGEFNREIPTSVMLMTIFSLFSPRSHEKLILKDSIPADDLVQYLIRVCFDGIAEHKIDENLSTENLST